MLHNTTTFEEYEALYFFWLGIDTDTASKKQRLQLDKSAEDAVLKRLKKGASLSQITQAISIIESDIKELNILKEKFSFNEDYEADFAALNDVKNLINRLSTENGRLSIRRDIISEAQEELQKEQFTADIDVLREIYDAAEALMPKVQAKFEQLVAFHNSMLSEKIEFISKELPHVESALAASNKKLQEAVASENELSEKLKKAGAIEELETIIQSLNTKHQQKGMYEEQLRQWKTSTKNLEDIEKKLKKINDDISSYGDELEESIAAFNKFFSKISQKLYDEQFILSQTKNDRAYQLEISSIGGLGTGKKKGLTAAFDIAYVEFCDEMDIPCIHFILHDQIETIHDNQLTLIADVAEEANAQFIVPVLQDKLPPTMNGKAFKVLSLSQDEKLFKV